MNKLGFLLLFCLATAVAMAQPKLNSPYTRFGMGQLAPSYFAAQGGQAGLTTAFADPYHLNLANPASFSALRSTALETGLYAQNSQFQAANSASLNTWSGNLAYFALGFTLRNPINEALERQRPKWRHGMGFSLTPYSNVGYTVQTRDSTAVIGTVQNNYEGTGGTYKLAWHAGSRYKNTAFGATAGYLFGRSKYENTTSFIDPLPTMQNNFIDQYSVRGFVYNLGIQHDFVFQRSESDKETPTKWVTIGATFEGQHSPHANADIIRLRSRGKDVLTGRYIDADTLVFEDGAKKKLTLPAQFGFGVQYVKLDRFKIGAQVNYAGWSDYVNEVRPEKLKNTISTSIGMEIIPEYNSYNKYMKRVRYRFGAYYRQDPRVITNNQQETQLDDYGVTLGLGFPLILPRQQTSFVNFAVEAGRLGYTSTISETYVRMTLGFTFNDNSWFFKRRFE